MTIKRWMIYGANGYTGTLIVAEAVKRGHTPIVAGRNKQALLSLVEQFSLDYCCFELNDYREVKKDIEGCGIVLNCAGPFSHTAEVLRKACVETGVHYLDISGEYQVLEASYQTHSQARKNGCVVISGVGFDVVPTDFLAAKLKEQLPSATHVELAFAGSGGISPGTAKTLLEMLPQKGFIRSNGEIQSVAIAYQAKNITFSDTERFCVSIPWGDITTAFYTTDIPNICIFTAIEPAQLKWMKALNYVVFILNNAYIQHWLKQKITTKIQGPNEKEREAGFMRLWGRAYNADEEVSLVMDTPEGYQFTVISALLFVEALLAHKILPGAYTPSQALPSEAIFNMLGVKLYS